MCLFRKTCNILFLFAFTCLSACETPKTSAVFLRCFLVDQRDCLRSGVATFAVLRGDEILAGGSCEAALESAIELGELTLDGDTLTIEARSSGGTALYRGDAVLSATLPSEVELAVPLFFVGD